MKILTSTLMVATALSGNVVMADSAKLATLAPNGHTLIDSKVGDIAIYNATPNSNVVRTLSQEFKVEVSSYDSATETYSLTLTFGGQKPFVTKISAAEMEKDGSSKQIFDGCRASGGMFQSVTVEAGTFLTCHITNKNGSERWVARDIPCADVKGIYTDGQGGSTTATLKSYNCIR